MTRRNLCPSATTALAMATLVLAPALALAQVDVPVPEPQESPNKTELLAGYEHMFNTDIDKGGQMQRDSLLLRLSHAFEVGESTALITNLTYQLDSYDWSKGAKNGGKSGVPAAGFRWSEINTPQLVGLLRTKLNDNWGLFGVGLIRMSAETGANLDDAVTYGGGIGFNWVADDKKLSLGLLTGVLTVIEDDPTFAVLPLVKWQFADAWRFTLEPIYTGAIGYGPELTFSPTDSLELGLGASYQKRRFRLDSHKTVKNGVGQETTAPIFLRCGWKPGDGMLLDLYAGVDVAGHVRTARKGGGKLRGNDYDAAPMLGASFTYKF